MTKLKWYEWKGSHVLRDAKTARNFVWVDTYPDLGWSISVWNPELANLQTNGDWERIAHHSDLETAKSIAMIYAKGNLL
jgi:hypothetical protein